jgi:hypothetical protein
MGTHFVGYAQEHAPALQFESISSSEHLTPGVPPRRGEVVFLFLSREICSFFTSF